jgi:putative ABC transport system permease protein
MSRLLSLIVKNSWRNRRRTILTVLSVAASMCLLGLLFAIYHMFYLTGAPPEQALRLMTRNRVSLAVPIPLYYREQIKQIPGVREAIIFEWFGGTYKDSRDPKNMFGRFATEPDKFFILHPEDIVPEDQKKAFQSERTACMIGRQLADTLNLKLGDRMTIVGDIYPVTLELTVRAVYDAPSDTDGLIFHYKYLEESLSKTRASMIDTFSVLAGKPEDVPRVAQAIDDHFRNSPYPTKTESEKAFQLSFVSFLGNVKMFLLSVCSALTFTILLVSANTMAMSVRERIHEIGILKTLGFTPGSILGLILGEAAVIAILGGLLGCFLAEGLAAMVRSAPESMMFRSLIIPMPVNFFSLGVAVLIGLVSAFFPARNAARTSILDALGHTG